VPVLIEAISVVVKRRAINLSFPGGWDAFKDAVPNSTLCYDNELARVGFMHPHDVERFVKGLVASGLRYIENGEAQDLTVMDQSGGPMVATPWVETGTLRIDEIGGPVTACRLVDSDDWRLVTPAAWKYAGSMSQNNGFVDDDEAKKHLKFLRTDNGVDVYLDTRTGKELFMGRPAQGSAP